MCVTKVIISHYIIMTIHRSPTVQGQVVMMMMMINDEDDGDDDDNVEPKGERARRRML